MKKSISRKEFLTTSAIGAVTAAGVLSVPAMLTGCSSASTKDGASDGAIREGKYPELLTKAVDGKPLKAALIGCGGRGTGALVNFLEAGDGLSVVALADVFQDKIDDCRETLAGKGVTIDDDKCFVGFDAYEKIMASDADIVFLCTPPYFRPIHFKAAVEAGKHIFNEKPAAVDSAGIKDVLLASKNADMKGLKIISGTIRRSQRDCVETYKRVCEGAIGEIVSANVMRNGGALWAKGRQKGWSDMEYMLRNWVNFNWLSGDHIVEQFVHEVDQMYWFVGKMPVSALGYGGRQRRVTGDMYDFFSVCYEFEDGKRAQCSSRQISGCSNGTTVMVYGTKGYTNCAGKIFNLDGTIKWEYPYPKKDDTDKTNAITNPFVQEHIRLVTAIRRDEKLNDTEEIANSTLLAIMGRNSAYTGQLVTAKDAMADMERLGPAEIKMGSYPEIVEEIPRAGVPSETI